MLSPGRVRKYAMWVSPPASLYPWVNKNCPYPIGHLQIITQPFDQSLESYFGLATVDILPPTGLFHPVLPMRSGQKLTFPLCHTCVQKEETKPMLDRTQYCPHSDADRMLRGTWYTRNAAQARSLQGLCQHVVESETGIGGVAQLMPDGGAETRVYSQLSGTGRDPFGDCPHRQKSRTQGHRQVDAEQLLRQIRRAYEQTHHRHRPRPRSFDQTDLRCRSRYQHPPIVYRRHPRGRVHQRPRECRQRVQDQYFRGGLHHVSRSAQTLRVP